MLPRDGGTRWRFRGRISHRQRARSRLSQDFLSSGLKSTLLGDRFGAYYPTRLLGAPDITTTELLPPMGL